MHRRALTASHSRAVLRSRPREGHVCNVSLQNTANAFRRSSATSLPPHPPTLASDAIRLLDLLLGAKLVGVAALLLAAVGGAGWQAGIALAADHLLAVVLGGQGLEGGLDDASAETENQVQSRLLLDVVVAQSATVLELLAGEDQALLVGWDALLVWTSSICASGIWVCI